MSVFRTVSGVTVVLTAMVASGCTPGPESAASDVTSTAGSTVSTARAAETSTAIAPPAHATSTGSSRAASGPTGGVLSEQRARFPEPDSVVDPVSDDDASVFSENYIHATWSTERVGLLLVTLTGSTSCHSHVDGVVVDGEQRIRVTFAAEPSGPRTCTRDLSPYTTAVVVPADVDPTEPASITADRGRSVGILPIPPS